MVNKEKNFVSAVIYVHNAENRIENLDEKDIEFATTFIFNGAIGVINYWVQNEFNNSVDEIQFETISASYILSSLHLFFKILK